MTEMEIDKAWEKLEKAEELVRQKEHKLQQVENRFKHMRNQKDRERTHHLYERAGMLADAWVYNPVVQNCDGRDMRPYMNAVMILTNMCWIVYKQMQVLHDNGLMDFVS